MPVFLLIRHGHTLAGNRLAGRLPGFGLSERGRYQAERISSDLGAVRIDRIYSSPLERTRDTSLPLSVRTGIPPEPDEAFTEVDFGTWSGKSFEELEADPSWRLFHTFRTGTRPPGGELMGEVQLRFVLRLLELGRAYPEETMAIFSHADPIRAALAYFLGIPLDHMLRFIVATGSISILSLNEYGPVIHGVNRFGPVRLEESG